MHNFAFPLAIFESSSCFTPLSFSVFKNAFIVVDVLWYLLILIYIFPVTKDVYVFLCLPFLHTLMNYLFRYFDQLLNFAYCYFFVVKFFMYSGLISLSTIRVFFGWEGGCLVECEILVPWPGLEPIPLAVEASRQHVAHCLLL